MEASTEQKLLRTLLSKTFYNKVRAGLRKEVFSAYSADIFEPLEALHAKTENDLELDDLKSYFYVKNDTLTVQQKRIYNNIFDGIDQEQKLDDGVATEMMRECISRSAAVRIGDIALGIINGTQPPDFSAIIKEAEAGSAGVIEEQFEELSTEVKDFADILDPKNLFKFSNPGLAELTGAGRGNFVEVLARPEVGKTSFCTELAVGFAEQGLNVHYFGNEEPGKRLLMSMLRAVVNKSDTEIREMFLKGHVYDEWEKIKGYLRLFDCVGMHIDDLHRHTNRHSPDVVFVDQLDKFKVSNSESKTLALASLYVSAREIAKKEQCLIIAVGQASADAQDVRYIDYSMADYSKTGKAAEADLIIGIGKDPGTKDNLQRYLTISKNKIDGIKGSFDVLFDGTTNNWITA